jgi:hypothetical protein
MGVNDFDFAGISALYTKQILNWPATRMLCCPAQPPPWSNALAANNSATAAQKFLLLFSKRSLSFSEH